MIGLAGLLAIRLQVKVEVGQHGRMTLRNTQAAEEGLDERQVSGHGHLGIG
jgi:hypothetical protein